MGLNKTTSNAIWIGLSEGKFFVGKKAEATEFYPAFEGLLIAVGFRDGEFQGVVRRDCILTFLDDGKKYKVSFNVSSGYGKQTLMKLPNCDVAQRIELCPTYEDEGGNKKAGMFVNQSSGSIKQKWTKDNPGELPQVKSLGIVKGKEVWDDSAQCEWLEDYIMKNVTPACLRNVASHSTEASHESGDSDGSDHEPPEQREAPPAHGDDGLVPF